SDRQRVGFGGVDAVFRDGLGDLFAFDLAFVGQRFERREDDPVAIDLEEVAQLFACVGAAEAVGAEHGVAAGNPSANLLGIQFDVVGGRHDRAFGAVEAGGDVRFFRR